MDMFRKRSVVWSYFKDIDSSTVQCVICSGFLVRNNRGSTTPMLRHLRLKHPVEVFSSDGRITESGVCVDHRDIKVVGEQFCSVEVALEEGDSDSITTVNDAHLSAAISGLLAASHEGPAEQITHAEARVNRPVRHTRRRSLIWRLFEQLDSLDAARCRICTKRLHVSGGISNLRRHLSKRHPEVLSELLASGQQPPADPHHSNADGVLVESFLGSEQMQGSVEVALEDGNSDLMTTLNETDNPVINGLPGSDSAQQETHADASDERPARKRSLIWRHFQRLDSLDAARCRICMRTLQCFEGRATGNLRRHLLNKHPKVFSELVANTQQQPPPSNSTQDSNGDGGIDETSWEMPVEVDDDDSDIITLNETDNPINNGLLDSMQGHSAQQIPRAEVSSDHNESWTRRHSLIWRHFEQLDSLNAARCRICMKKLQCFQSGGTSNLHQHLSKRHPKVFSELLFNWKHQSSNSGTAAEQKQIPGELKVSGASVVERRMFNREMELIEALRRTQREEARTLEHQRELLEVLRAAGAREAEVERERIESLRKAQQVEAKDLSKQRKELEMEKAELQKKWEELHQEREKLLSGGGQETS
ncbi:uncharacterized protein PAE49_004516 [Odontesthes bonariensis]|uniref:uncharacterized protein LOC142384873 n=1 Tax=Odontesthes bonariensis TaxID=219752 RepID=UPI003F583AF8